MARGWESKAVEAQQQEAVSQTQLREQISAAETAKRNERLTLQLARTRAQGDLQHACAPAHRAMLEQAISDLDKKIKLLS